MKKKKHICIFCHQKSNSEYDLRNQNILWKTNLMFHNLLLSLVVRDHNISNNYYNAKIELSNFSFITLQTFLLKRAALKLLT